MRNGICDLYNGPIIEDYKPSSFHIRKEMMKIKLTRLTTRETQTHTRRAIFPEMCKINQSSVDFHCKPFGWLIDWRWVNFNLIGLLDSYRPICFYGGGAKVTEHNGMVSMF